MYIYICPKCGITLKKSSGPFGIFWLCPHCSGRLVSLNVLRRIIPQNFINKLWQRARSGEYESHRVCSICDKDLPEVPIIIDDKTICLDVCTKCNFVWFDTREYESFPKVELPEPKEEEQLSLEARKALALLKIESMKKTNGFAGVTEDNPPEYIHQKILGFLGLPIEYNEIKLRHQPFMTWLIGISMGIITMFSLGGGLQPIIDKYGLIPAEFSRFYGLTFISSFFLHAGFLHLLSNLYFLLVFGDNVEDVLGKKKYILLIILASLAGDFFHIIFDPNKSIPCVGASAGISGILVYYCLRFPSAKMGIFYFYYFTWGWLSFNVKTFIVLWIILQVFISLEQAAGMVDISGFAHLGGASVGLFFWLSEKRSLSKNTSKAA